VSHVVIRRRDIAPLHRTPVKLYLEENVLSAGKYINGELALAAYLSGVLSDTTLAEFFPELREDTARLVAVTKGITSVKGPALIQELLHEYYLPAPYIPEMSQAQQRQEKKGFLDTLKSLFGLGE
jgi:hypothetical protein